MKKGSITFMAWFLVFGIFIFLYQPSLAIATVLEHQLFPNDDPHESYFGASVDKSGDYAVIGAPYTDGLSPDEGSVYIFKKISLDGCRRKY